MKTRLTRRGYTALVAWHAIPTTMALIATVAMTAAVLSTIGVICEKGPLTKRLHPDENTEH